MARVKLAHGLLAASAPVFALLAASAPVFALLAASAPALAGDGPVAPASPAMVTYQLKGAALLRPIRIGDDGVHTYIQWSEDQPIPAVFALDPRGSEQIVDGYMRGDLFTIDRVYPHLVFRIDKDKAEARRNAPGGVRQ